MRSRNTRRGMAVAASLVAAGVVLAGCASSDDDGDNEASGSWLGEGKSECKGLEQLADFGDLSGKTVSVYTSILPPEQKAQEDSYKLFTTCTGAKVKYEGSDQFETQLVVRVKANNAPDIAYIPQPGLLKTVVASGQVVEAPAQVSDNVDKWKLWKDDKPTYNAWFEDMSGVSADPKKPNLAANAATSSGNANPAANPTTSAGGDD